MKGLANAARKEMLSTGKVEYNSAAKAKYQTEVNSLTAKLNIALKNAPRERQAQIIANAEVKAKVQDNPAMTREEKKKAGQQALTRARNQVGAQRSSIKITDKEWEAIQKGAVSETILKNILNNTDTDEIRKRATPRKSSELSNAQISRLKALSASGYTNAEIADSLGISSSTVTKYLK